MAEKRLKTKIALRRDIANNYSASYVALKGEVLFVEKPVSSERTELRVKVGDGITPYYALPYLDTQNNIVNWGYYLNGKFYKDSTYTAELEKSEVHLYIDTITNKLYIYDGSNYVCVDEMIPNASAQQAGIMKLYNNQGQNTDGTITQKFFTDSIDNIIFGVDENDNECLVLEKPW